MRAVAVLARAPSSGGKTRLTAGLSPDDARALREALLLDTLDQACAARVPVTLFFTPLAARDEVRALVGERVRLRPQEEGDLGVRMFGAFVDLFTGGASHVALTGSDLPALPSSRVVEAFAALDRGVDVVLGPAEDGGYYLVALSRPRPSLFDRIAWSSRDVLRQTLGAASSEGLSVSLLEAWSDVDTPEDLARLQATGAAAPRTRAWLAAR